MTRVVREATWSHQNLINNRKYYVFMPDLSGTILLSSFLSSLLVVSLQIDCGMLEWNCLPTFW